MLTIDADDSDEDDTDDEADMEAGRQAGRETGKKTDKQTSEEKMTKTAMTMSPQNHPCMSPVDTLYVTLDHPGSGCHPCHPGYKAAVNVAPDVYCYTKQTYGLMRSTYIHRPIKPWASNRMHRWMRACTAGPRT